MKITPVILSGGFGTRLWPISRSLMPKQFLDFFGENSLFQKTALRVKNDQDFFYDPIIVCNNEHRFHAAEELKKANISPQSIILEPSGRNTAPAIAIGALELFFQNNLRNEGNESANKNVEKNDVMLVMPSDHVITNEELFISWVKKAALVAQDSYLVTFGIVPTHAETGYGYIKKSQKILKFDGVFDVEEFVEKPDKSSAEQFIKSQKYLWNSGIFVFRASVYLEYLQKLQNEIFMACCNAHNKAVRDLDFIRLFAEDFEKCSNISVDYAIMEKVQKLQKVAVMPLDAGWSDVGSWHAVSELSPKDQNQNSLLGDATAIATKNCYINARDLLVTTIGVENLIIIALKDAVLIANKNCAQDVKELFEILKKQKREECHSHSRVLRPWGSFEIFCAGDRFKIKKIIVKPKAAISLQMHNHRNEHWVVIGGTANVTCGNSEFILTENESTYVPIGKKHRLENKGQIPLEIIEVQTGSYLGEDDIIRFNDFYGRL